MRTFFTNLIEALKGARANYGIIDWNQTSETNLAKFYFVLIAALIFLGIPILLVVILTFIKKQQLSKKGTVILYAFVTGFFITLAFFGFAREALEISSTQAGARGYTTNQIYGWNILLVGFGLALGVGFGFGLKKLVDYIAKSKVIRNDAHASAFVHSHDLLHDNDAHDHTSHSYAPDHSVTIATQTQSQQKNKIVALLLILTHRIPAGLIIGYSLNSFFEVGIGSFNAISGAFLISFVLHLIPEILIFYFRQLEMGVTRAKACGWSIASLLMLIPLMYIGIYLGKYINQVWQLSAFLQACVGGIFVFTGVIEFLPEFYHAHHEPKIFKRVMFAFFLGIIVCVIILAFHTHK
ncbi:ZIP family metal transporter [Mycoplasmopsis columbinasalis]|uniref:ZIP Zinc transporter n=1 Tax=Mycoplasmopsis columbinasalis TaxID=114880 RepID=A0A449BB17_9BACT|nr:ZIP family metal transporter [Mycoplasmopsis columbinasalis]VEU78396.1 ZIP Zinc transporter [Mycoplasmopsis columbinasalis]